MEVADDPESVAKRSLDLFVSRAEKAIGEKGVFYVAISGGQTPRRFFELLAETEQGRALAWDKVHLFWVDERLVPTYSEWSNYNLASQIFLDRVAIPPENVHHIRTDYGDFAVAAASYEQTIRKVFGIEVGQLPEFDLILLGMGTDGHIGSLFPDSYACFDTCDLACVVYVMGDRHDRVTLTRPVMCAASHLVVLVCGQEKAEILQKVFYSDPEDIRYPAHILWPVLHKVTWLVDKDAAQAL